MHFQLKKARQKNKSLRLGWRKISLNQPHRIAVKYQKRIEGKGRSEIRLIWIQN
jgi:hypothetical protein